MSVLFADNLRFFDTTLRDGEQTPGVSLNPEQKFEIASRLSDIGIDVIEAGSAAASDGEREAIRRIAEAGLKAEICTYVRALREDIDYAADLGADSVHLVIPVSDLHITKKLRKNRDQVAAMAYDAVEYAKGRGLIVELSGEDASRADQKFLHEIFSGGVERGADRLCFCDTVGLLTPEKTAEYIPPLSAIAPLSIHCHDDLGFALANTMAALKAGAGCAHVTINGLGERAGNTPFEEVVMALEVLYGYRTRIVEEKIYPLASLVSRHTGVALAVNKAIVGEMAFTHESGIHAHGVMREPSTYESVKPEMVGRKRRIVLGKHSGTASVEAALHEMNYNADEKQVKEIVKRVKQLGDEGKRVTDADLMAVADAVLSIECKPVIKMRQFTATSGSHMIPTASVTLVVNGQEMTGAATGDGPVDAAMEVLRKCVSDVADIRLEEYHVDAISGGTDALVEVTVRLSKDGKIITSRGARTDIIMASVEAMIAGMNRLLRDRT
ncbi:2-isopropylmalate synthase [Methanoregula formicica]|uniref:Putative (R)-citramalate synthase CimA n=1 Tax=Methanoregula formicica (strain DSM 22288 / NBRC 105244 / SMSP) TaxID=593750 RepID=L0HFE1_METFS|nr:2-isopropylmalate synthase [Methanoregula formicica]AGB02710.1 isopropylmalate/citramalate/homocitrate synthase [Methanoregula formicica SMSP]